MGTQMVPLSVPVVGAYGLNKQNQDTQLPIGWATEASNLVFNERGTLESRKGLSKQHAAPVATDIGATHEYIDGDGNSVLIFAAANKIYSLVNGLISDISSATITLPTGNNWQFTNFNGTCVGYQEGHTPIVLTTTTGTFADATGTQYQSNMVCSAYGRLWTVSGDNLYYSDLLINNFSGGSSGSFSLAEYWTDGGDEAVAITEWNNYLLVFGKRSIIVYANADDPTNTMVISENIGVAGCVARDSIAKMGNDLFFLSYSGVRSLGRVLEEKSLPIREISINVKDYALQLLSAETDNTQIKSIYAEQEGFYLLSFPASNTTLVFDVTTPVEGSYRCTEWDIAFTALAASYSGTVYLAKDMYISTYEGYYDYVDGYTINYEGVWYDFGQEVSAYLKLPKRLVAFVNGTTGDTFTIKWYFDFDDTQYSETVTINSDKQIRTPMRGSGQVIKTGFSATVEGSKKTIKKYNLFAKLGRV